MADNYIEKQREEYEARKAAWEKARKYGKPAISQQNKSVAPITEKKKRVFVTGGAEGIGKAIVQAFCNAGYRVAFCDKNETAGQQLAKETGTVFYQVDVSDQESLERCMQRIFLVWGDIDIIVNNAGISKFSPITETSIDDFDNILSVNLRPAFIHALAVSLSEWHITVNSIAPGWIQNHDYEQLRTEDHTQHTSGRVGKPEDIARMCLFLSQEENDFINGENITIDGGMTKKMIYVE